MFASITTFIAISATVVSAASIPVRSISASITPHAQFSSSIGVLGCKINTNRVAYWPGAIGCNDICVKVTYEGRSLNLLRIDTSGGAYDISYDAWNYLAFGKSATESPQQGGGVPMDYEVVDASQCSSLLATGKLPLAAANSMNYVSACLAQPDSWVAKNYELYNIANSVCTVGHDEICTLNMAVSNQPTCPHTLGSVDPLSNLPVIDIAYGTGLPTVAL